MRQRASVAGAVSVARTLQRLLAFAVVWMLGAAAQAQQTAPVPPPPAPVAVTAHGRFSQEDLDRLLAPIALYPDELLAQILMASTYPLEVVEADRWLRAHPGISGEALQRALQTQDWDPSVKGLAGVPRVLAMMDERLDWTESLGDAFLAQEADVMETVQRLRARAQAAGNLGSTLEQTVVDTGGTLVIEPANPEVIYVPVYDPMSVYGVWWWPQPPFYWYPPGYVVAGPGIYFGIGFPVGAAIWGYFDWGLRTVLINARRYDTFTRTRIGNVQWRHDVRHRRGVPYRDDATRARYGRELPGAETRRQFRGYEPPVPRQRQAPAPVARQPQRAPVQTPAPVRPQRSAPSPAPRPKPTSPTGSRPAPPAFESFGSRDATRAASRRGAESRARQSGTRGGGSPANARPQGGAQRSAPAGARPQGGRGGSANGGGTRRR